MRPLTRLLLLHTIFFSSTLAQYQKPSIGAGYYSAVSKDRAVGRVSCLRLALRSGFGNSSVLYGSVLLDVPTSQPTALVAFHIGIAGRFHPNLGMRINTGIGQLKLVKASAPSGFEELHGYLGFALETDVLRVCNVEAGIQQRFLIPYLGALPSMDMFFALWFQL